MLALCAPQCFLKAISRLTAKTLIGDRVVQDICETALWRVRAFSNPFYIEGEEVDGVRAISINCEARVPLFLPNGQPVVARRKDAQGNKIGDPVPIEPSGILTISPEGVVGIISHQH